MLPPFFLKGVSDEGIIHCYRQVIDAVADPRLKLYLYHIPQVTGVGLSHHVIATLKSEYPKIILGIKDSACTTAHSVGLAEAFMKDLTVYVGFEPDLPEMGRRGSTGAISGLANFMPRVVDRLVMQPDAPSVPGERDRVISLISSLDAYSLMPALKGIMVSLTGDVAWLRVRAPLVALTPAQLAAIGQVVREFSLDLAKD
jgi:4-hydroxy-tetrahydrodipicolinate synthase